MLQINLEGPIHSEALISGDLNVTRSMVMMECVDCRNSSVVKLTLVIY